VNLLGSHSAGEFLARNWQKQPLFVKGAFKALSPELSSGELAWLATQPDVESRLVFTERHPSGAKYRVEQGPFEEGDLESLPDRDWSLLVQDVDKHLPVFRALVSAVSFIPDWRVDDLMVSFAAPGGSVGPHLDNYDVFLCQGDGCREWRLTESGTVDSDKEAGDLRLLQPFAGDPVLRAEHGDVLYLPPGVPHWGLAITRCMTYSVGMRAPEAGETRLAIERMFPNDVVSDSAVGSRFYADPDLSVDEAAPGQISAESLQRARQCFRFAASLDERKLARVFGVVATDPKAWIAPEGLSQDTVGGLVIHGMAKFAWYENGEIRLIFANGFDRFARVAELKAFKSICSAGRDDRFSVDMSDCPDLKQWLLEKGAFDRETPTEDG